jgi:hypothetical protein
MALDMFLVSNRSEYDAVLLYRFSRTLSRISPWLLRRNHGFGMSWKFGAFAQTGA